MAVWDAVELAQAILIRMVFVGNVAQCFGTVGGVGGQAGQLARIVAQGSAKFIGTIGGYDDFAVERSNDHGFFMCGVEAFEFVFG